MDDVSITKPGTKIADIRLAVMRAIADVNEKLNRPVRTYEVYPHHTLAGENVKRIAQTINNCKVDKQLEADVAGNLTITDKGRDFILRHARDDIRRIPKDEPTPRGHQVAAVTETEMRSKTKTRTKANGKSSEYLGKAFEALVTEREELKERLAKLEVAITTLKDLHNRGI